MLGLFLCAFGTGTGQFPILRNVTRGRVRGNAFYSHVAAPGQASTLDRDAVVPAFDRLKQVRIFSPFDVIG